MIFLSLTRSQVEELLFATSQLYQDYVDELGSQYNESIRRYNNSIDELRQTIKEQLKEQE